MLYIDENWWWIFALCASVVLVAVLAVLLVFTGISYHRRRALHRAIWDAQKQYSRLLEEEEEEALHRSIARRPSSRSIGTDLPSGGDLNRSMYSIYSDMSEQSPQDSMAKTGEHKKAKRKQTLPTALSMRDLSRPRVSVAPTSDHSASRRASKSGSQAVNPPTQRHHNASTAPADKEATTTTKDEPTAYANVDKPQDMVPEASPSEKRAPTREASLVGRGFTNGGSNVRRSRSMRQQSFIIEDVEMLDSPTDGRGSTPPPAATLVSLLTSSSTQRTAAPPTTNRVSPMAAPSTGTRGSSGGLPFDPFSMVDYAYYYTEGTSSPYTYDTDATR